MANWITEHESTLRLSVFLGVLILMALLETLFPRKIRTQDRTARWGSNLALVIIDSLVVRLLFPIIAVGAAAFAFTKGWGVLNLIDLPAWVGFIMALILLDLSVYIQHVAFHKIPVLWSVHKVHHADRDIDATTGVRFHPIEIVISMIYKIAVVILLGPSVLAVIIFEIILNASAMFNHANVRLPKTFDRILRVFFVTPDMHRIHHSVHPAETDSNYGFNLSLWDHVFKTYREKPKDGHIGMKIGLSEYQSNSPSSLVWLLILPFKR